MELFLNLFWLLIAVALLATWRTKWVPQRRRSLRHCLQEWSAVSLALVLLFFAVSMTDDMHYEIVALVEGSANKRDQIGLPTAHPSAPPSAATHSPVWAIVPSGPSVGCAHQVRAVTSSGRSFVAFFSINPASSRAPPVSFL